MGTWWRSTSGCTTSPVNWRKKRASNEPQRTSRFSITCAINYVINQSGSREDAQKILLALERQFADAVGSRWLYTLFPGGPVHQGMKIAGLPEAPHAIDPAYGTVR